MDTPQSSDAAPSTSTNQSAASCSSSASASLNKNEMEVEADQSSDSTNKQERRTKRRYQWKKGIPSEAKNIKQLIGNLSSATPVTKPIQQVMLKSLQDLKKVFTHIAEPNLVKDDRSSSSSSSCAAGAAGATGSASASSSSSSTNTSFPCLKAEAKMTSSTSTMFATDSQSGTVISDNLCWETEYLKAKAREMRPQFYLQGAIGKRLSQEQLLGHIATRELDLPVLGVDYMQELLCEAGRFAHPLSAEQMCDFPPCSNNTACIGLSGVFKWNGSPREDKKKGVVFVSLMFENEYEALLKSGVKPPSRPCVACCIRSLTESILAHRFMRMLCRDISTSDDQAAGAASSNNNNNSNGSLFDFNVDDASLVFGKNSILKSVHQLFRNPIDCPGGFFKDYTLHDPDATEKFIDPILCLNLSTVALEVGALNRIRLNIGMLAWQPKPSVALQMGTKLLTHIKESQFLLNNERFDHTSQHKRRVDYMRSLICSLLSTVCLAFPSYKLYRVIQNNKVKLGLAKLAMVDDSIPKRYSLFASLLVDTTRNSSAVCWGDALGVWTLPVLQQEMFLLSFCTPMNQKSTLVYLLSKMIPERCNTRKFGGVAPRKFRQSPRICDIFKLLVACSLLGNYETCTPSTRLTGDSREWIYEKLVDRRASTANHEWFLYLVSHCSYLVEFCVREHILFQLYDNPSLKQHVELLLPLHHYETVLCKAMDTARLRLHVLYELGVSHRVVCLEMHALLKPFHDALLSVSYRVPKSQTEMLSKLTSVRDIQQQQKKHVVGVSISYNQPDRPSIGTDGRDDAVEVQEEELLQSNPGKLASLLLFQKKLEKLMPSTIADVSMKRSNNIVLPKASAMLGEQRLFKLKQLVQVIAPTRDDCLQTLVHLFPLLGVSVYHAKWLRNILEEFRLGCINDTAFPVHLKLLKESSRMTYDLLQISVDLIKHYTRVKLIRKLPAHMIEGQLLATQNAMPVLVGTDHGLYDSSEFVWCSICGAIYSMVRESKSNWKKVYAYGLRDVIVDYETDMIYCWRGCTTYAGKCAEVPLVRISLFGVILQHEGRNYILCPQPTCGMPMVLDTDTCAFTEYGPCCSECTEAEGSHEKAELKRLLDLEKAVHKCLLCGHELRTSNGKFYYAPDVYLCVRHHSKTFVRDLQTRAICKGEDLTNSEIKLLLIELFKKKKEEKAERCKGMWRRQLAQSKLMRSVRRR